MISTQSTYTRTLSNLSNSSDIFSWDISGMLPTSIGIFGTLNFPGEGQLYIYVFIRGIILYHSLTPLPPLQFPNV